jgi:hypothetical protein
MQATRRNPRDGRARSEGVLPAMPSSGTPDISYFREYDRVEKARLEGKGVLASRGGATGAGGRCADTSQP